MKDGYTDKEIFIGGIQACNMGANMYDHCTTTNSITAYDNTGISTNGGYYPNMTRPVFTVTDVVIKKRMFTNKEKLDYKNIEKIVFNKPTTIIVYKDGTREISRSFEEDFDEEKGVAMIMLNLVFNNNKAERKRFLKKYSKETKDIK